MKKNIENYSTTKSKKSITITSIVEYINIIKEYSYMNDIVYRGESKFHPNITASIFRNHIFEDAYVDISHKEKEILRDFKHEVFPYLDTNDSNAFMAYSQHHGLPTALVDITKNPFVALYFAIVSEPKEDGYVYLFDNNSIIPATDIINNYFDISGEEFLFSPKFLKRFIEFYSATSLENLKTLIHNLLSYIKKSNHFSYQNREIIERIKKTTTGISEITQILPALEENNYIYKEFSFYLDKLNYKLSSEDVSLVDYEKISEVIELRVNHYIYWYLFLLETLVEYIQSINCVGEGNINKDLKSSKRNFNFLPMVGYHPITKFNRKKNQQGQFLFQIAIVNNNIKFIQQYNTNSVLKIPKESKQELCKELDLLSINKKTLFNDPDSTAEYIKETYLQTENENREYLNTTEPKG